MIISLSSRLQTAAAQRASLLEKSRTKAAPRTGAILFSRSRPEGQPLGATTTAESHSFMRFPVQRATRTIIRDIGPIAPQPHGSGKLRSPGDFFHGL